MSKTNATSEPAPAAVSIRTAMVITGLGRSSIYGLLAQKRLGKRLARAYRGRMGFGKHIDRGQLPYESKG